MTVMFQRGSPAHTNVTTKDVNHKGVTVKGERKRSSVMPPPTSTCPPFKKPKLQEPEAPAPPHREVGGRLSQGCQTLPPPPCKHGDEDEELCSIGTPVNLPATVWYEDRDGLLVVNVTWRGRTYVGTLMESSKSEHIAEQYKGRMRKESRGEQASQKRLEEEQEEEQEEPLPEKILRDRKTSKTNVYTENSPDKEEKVVKKMYRCDKCNKEYKYPSGLSYHNKNTHEKIRTERE